MIEQCALYFPSAKLPLEKVFPNGRSDKGLFRSTTWFEYESDDGVVRLNLALDDLEQHLNGFKGYVAKLPNNGAARAEAQRLISRTKLCVGVVLPQPVAPDSDAFASLMHLIDQFDGFMFVADSILLPDGNFLVGPMAESSEQMEQAAEPSIRPVDPDACRHQGNIDGVDPARVALREEVYRKLAERGFRCARFLPLYRGEEGNEQLRPVDQIAGRLLALHALFLWVSAPEEMASSERIQSFVDRNSLYDHLTEEEAEILRMARSDAIEEHTDTIGWRLENMWALSWILGFEPAPPFYLGQIPQETIEQMLFEFLPNLDASLSEFAEGVVARPVETVALQEDLFYCAHNAVTSAQLGEDTVPQEFHPVRDGGAIHERRHALTWALSPDTDWDETDLST